MSRAGYDPRKMIGSAEQGEAPAEIISTHPSAPNRVQTIEAAIAEIYPGDVPAGLQP